jgi:two-component system, cell cycle sensor histidine kinase and response regulator CckA
VEWEENQGTTVDIYLPACGNAIPDGSSKEEEEASASIGRVLVMDDEEMIRNITERILEAEGYKVDLVENGEQALALYRDLQAQGRPFDGVILDLTLGEGMTGLETIEALRKVDPSVKAMVLSGYSEDPVMLHYEQYGFKGALAKPFMVKDLRDTLARVIGRRFDSTDLAGGVVPGTSISG